MIATLLLIPLGGGLVTFFIRQDRLRRGIFLFAAFAHLACTLINWTFPARPALEGWLAMDETGLLFLTVTSVVFFCASLYGVSYLSREAATNLQDSEEGIFFHNTPEAIFTGCLLVLLASMTLVTLSHHFGLLWVAVEATTLSSAPLIYFHRHHRSLEAAWKYLLICSVGIALALLGIFFLAASVEAGRSGEIPLILGPLTAQARWLHGPWLKVAFILLLIGYGTKMGLAPLHTWLPDAHSESPSVVSALLSGALLNCAFLGLLRMRSVCVAAGLGDFANAHFVGFGLVSLGTAAVFIFGQTDYKRLLAYSSVEHMGILSLGIGLGQAGAFGALLHAVNHSFAKAALFLLAGNILGIYKSKSAAQVYGVMQAAPRTGVLFLAGLLAITGFPPFGTFVSEFAILEAAINSNRYLTAGLYLLFLAVIFMGMVSIILPMMQGSCPDDKKNSEESWLRTLSPALLLGLVLALGLFTPHFLVSMLERISAGLGRF